MQTAEGALNEVSTILTRRRKLAIQSVNGSVSNQDKETLDEEFQSLINESVDVAYETAQMTRKNVLQQGSICVLSQAYLQPQSALQLLQ